MRVSSEQFLTVVTAVMAVQAVLCVTQTEVAIDKKWGKGTAASNAPAKTITAVLGTAGFGRTAVVAGALASGMDPEAAVNAGVCVLLCRIAYDFFVGGNMTSPPVILMNAGLAILGFTKLLHGQFLKVAAVVTAVQAVQAVLFPEVTIDSTWGEGTAISNGPAKTMTKVFGTVGFGAAAVLACALASGMSSAAAVYASVCVVVSQMTYDFFFGEKCFPPTAVVINAALIILGLIRFIVGDPYIPPACCWDTSS